MLKKGTTKQYEVLTGKKPAINDRMRQYGLMKDLDKRMQFALGQPATMMLAMDNTGKFITELQDDVK